MQQGATATLPDILARIVERKAEELHRSTVPMRELEQQADLFTRRSFLHALRRRRPAIIAEIKKASPSRGILLEQLDPAALAATYESGGAAALSVLTDRDFFQGSLENMKAARAATALPVLRKDFTTAEYHVIEAAAHGADAILLIAAILDSHQLGSFRQIAASFGMDALVEVHDEWELESALNSGAEIVGVNNRDLRTFEVHLEISRRLGAMLPPDALGVAESGIFTTAHIQELSRFQAFLVGESLMRSPDPAAAIRLLCS